MSGNYARVCPECGHASKLELHRCDNLRCSYHFVGTEVGTQP